MVALISHDLWQRAFAGDRGILGRVIQVEGVNTNVVGVMPQSFSFPPGELDPPEIWSPMQLPPPSPQRRGSHYLFLVGRLKPGVPLRLAQDEITRHVQQSADRIGQKNHPFSPDFHPIVAYGLQDEVVRTIRPALWTLMGAVAFVLLIACVNVANLLLARAVKSRFARRWARAPDN
jgi:putative ABC transport system permease protein